MCFLSGCYESTQETRNWVNSFKRKEYSKREKSFITELNGKGFFDVKIKNPHIGIVSPGLSTYELTTHTYKFDNKNNLHDSLFILSKNIANQLIIDVIEDSIIYDIGDIAITIFVDFNKNIKNKYFYKSYYKKQLEKDLGIKVIKLKAGKYKRVQI